MKTLDFFFDYGSPYSYLASTQMEALAERTGATVRWRVFLLGAVFKATTGESASTTMNSMQRAQYLFKDLQDWAAHYALPPVVLPATFPVPSILPDRLGLVAEEKGKLLQWTKRVYRAGFVDGRDISEEATLRELLRDVELDPDASLARAQEPDLKDKLRKNTEEAVEKGAFGAPTFFIGEQMFFGNDRLHFLEKALASASSR